VSKPFAVVGAGAVPVMNDVIAVPTVVKVGLVGGVAVVAVQRKRTFSQFLQALTTGDC